MMDFDLAKINKMTRTLPYVFTEHEVAMLAAVLKTKVASLTLCDHLQL